MRRLLANLVLMVILWSYAAPALLGPSQADLPACCRGRGKHHCAMMDAMNRPDDGSPAFRTNPPPCPYRQLGSVFNRYVAAVLGNSFSSITLPVADRFPSRVSARLASSLRIRNSVRGPPALSL
jgi:hypothetical protein